MRQVLYYPGILLPEEWVKKTILYSDKISSIHPHSFNLNACEGQKEKTAVSNMNYLESLGLYEYMRPEELSFITHEKIFKELVSILDKNLILQIRDNYKKHRYSYEIYRSKMSDQVIRFLTYNGIAKSNEPYSDGILVEYNVGLLYMSLLANHSTQIKKEYTTSTDQLSHQNILFEKSDTLNKDYNLNIILNNIPVPSELTSIHDILTFKKKRESELLLFRNYINNWSDRINNGVASLNSYKDEFDMYSKEISSLMKEDGIFTNWSTLEIALPSSLSLGAQWIGDSLDNKDLYSTLISTASAIGINFIKSKYGKNINDKNPLTYLHYIKREL
jgi:hypothetical protein